MRCFTQIETISAVHEGRQTKFLPEAQAAVAAGYSFRQSSAWWKISARRTCAPLVNQFSSYDIKQHPVHNALQCPR